MVNRCEEGAKVGVRGAKPRQQIHQIVEEMQINVQNIRKQVLIDMVLKICGIGLFSVILLVPISVCFYHNIFCDSHPMNAFFYSFTV